MFSSFVMFSHCDKRISNLEAFCVIQIVVYCMYVPTMAFFAKVSDPVIGGTYMTLLNTVCNLGL